MSNLGLSKKVSDKCSSKTANDIIEKMAEVPFDDQNFFGKIDNYINSRKKDTSIINAVLKLYCPYYKDFKLEDKYDLGIDEIQLLYNVNSFQSKQLGITIGDLYMSTKIVLCKQPKDCDLLGSYSVEQGDERRIPIVRLYMDAIEKEAESSKRDRKFFTAAVYIHEMMHRFYDVRPDLGWKQSVKEIEEPMAEFAKLSFCNEFNNKDLLKVASRLTKKLRNHKNHFYYAIGAELKNTDLIQKYRYVSLFMHQVSDKEKIEGVEYYPINEYLDKNKYTKENLKDLVKPLDKLINQYAKWFQYQ